MIQNIYAYTIGTKLLFMSLYSLIQTWLFLFNWSK